MKKLSARERRFVAEYLIDQNGKQSAIRAGYSKHTANEQASRLLTRVHVKAAVEKALKSIEDKSIMTARETLQELSKIGRSDIRKLFAVDGSLRPVSEWPDDVAGAVAGVDSDELFEGVGRDRERVGETKKVRLWDKGRALQDLARHHKLLIDKIEVKITDSLADRIKRARQRTTKK